MYEKKFLRVLVLCPGSRKRKTETVEVVLVRDSKGWLPLPPNGCDSMNGTMPCEFCCDALRRLFLQAPDTDTTKIISL